jgi:hypothetical protein
MISVTDYRGKVSLFLVFAPLQLTPTPKTVIKEKSIPYVLDYVGSPCNDES